MFPLFLGVCLGFGVASRIKRLAGALASGHCGRWTDSSMHSYLFNRRWSLMVKRDEFAMSNWGELRVDGEDFDVICVDHTVDFNGCNAVHLTGIQI